MEPPRAMTELGRCERSALRLLLASAIEISAAAGGW
jgi:hypothetical protein